MPHVPPKAASSHSESKFVVLLASARSGTHLLRGILATDPTIIDTGETFRPTNFDLPHSSLNFWKFLRGRRPISKNLPLTLEQRETQWRSYLAFLSRKTPDCLKILDFKYDNLRSADVGYLWPEEVPTVLRLAMKDKMPVIQLKRKNHLELFCSNQLALKTDDWVRYKSENRTTKYPSDISAIHVNPGNLLNILAAMQKREELVDSWVAGYARRIELIYEDLIQDNHLSGKVIDSIELLLGRKINIKPEPRTLKISAPLTELIENYDEVKSLLAGTPYAEFLSPKAKPFNGPRVERAAAPIIKNDDPGKPEVCFATKILSARPLLTLTGISSNLEGFSVLAEGAPEVFDTGRALHLIHLMWSLEVGEVDKLAQSIIQAQSIFPGHSFLPLTATEYETFLLAQKGIPSLLASGVIFLNEKVWHPRAPDIAGVPMFDAVYNARLDPFKRHELAQMIDSLLLVYATSASKSQSDAYERVRNILPRAFFANHRLATGGGLNHEWLCRLLGHAHVGLCLSAVEGAMRASMEYLLSGLPVVSTPSLGGRDRYYAAPYCRVVEAAPDAVAEAVRDLARKNLDRHRIRHHVAQMIGFDRYNFLLNMNKIAKLHLGQDALLPSFDPMIGAISTYRPGTQVVKVVRSEFANLTNTQLFQ